MALVAVVLSASTVVISPAAGSAQQSGISASIHEGTCNALGVEVASLEAAVVPASETQGVETALPAASSFTTVPISMDALVTSEHAIVVPLPAGEEIVATGDVGGTFADTGALMIGLAPSGDADISGTVYLSPGADPAQTNISLFFTGEGLESFLNTTFLPLPELAAEDVTHFSEIQAGRSSTNSLAGPFAGSLEQQAGARAVRGAGITSEDFVATVTFINPGEQTETSWDVGIAFHQVGEAYQAIYVDSV